MTSVVESDQYISSPFLSVKTDLTQIYCCQRMFCPIWNLWVHSFSPIMSIWTIKFTVKLQNNCASITLVSLSKNISRYIWIRMFYLANIWSALLHTFNNKAGWRLKCRENKHKGQNRHSVNNFSQISWETGLHWVINRAVQMSISLFICIVKSNSWFPVGKPLTACFILPPWICVVQNFLYYLIFCKSLSGVLKLRLT